VFIRAIRVFRVPPEKSKQLLLLTNKAKVNEKQQFGMTPLHLVVNRRFKELSELLPAHGADVNAKDNSGGTPLHYAKLSGNRDVAEILGKHAGHE
jgi:ankyrin repeat protein